MRACPQCGTEYPDETTFCKNDGTQLTETDKVEDGARQPGTVIGSYRLTRLLGEGGMGFVYLAEHTRLGRKVALKMLRSRYSNNPVAIKRFFREARSVNQINHENIVEITDFIEKEGEDNYYIMELLEGESVAEILDREGHLSVSRTLAIATQVCDALAAVHDAEIVHRDLKPDNVFLIRRSGRQDFVKLLDFGVAKLEDPVGERKAHQTAGGAILGTPEYMSPEQASSKPVDYRTDIYALGVILYEMLTGQQPFTGQSYGELVIKHVTIPPTPPSQLDNLPQAIPEALEELILECLNKDPEERPRHMQEIMVRLMEISASPPELQEPAAKPEKTVRPSRRTAGLVAAGVGLLAAAGVILATVSSNNPATENRDSRGPGTIASTVPQAAKVTKVKISFDSVPPGAAVTRNGSQQPLGHTPVTLALKTSPRPETFEFTLAGYQKAQREVSIQADAKVLVELKRDKKQPDKSAMKKTRHKKVLKKKRKKTDKKPPEGKPPDEKPPEKKPTPEDLGGTLDPFKDE